MMNSVELVTAGRSLQTAYGTVQGWLEAYRQWSDERYERDLKRRRAILAELRTTGRWDDEELAADQRDAATADGLARASEGLLLLDAAKARRGNTIQPRAFTPEQVALVPGLKRLLDEKHIAVFGPQNSGKTTLSLALLNAVIAAGHQVAIVDPHAELNPWPADVRTYGGGLDYAEIDRVLMALFEEMRLRYQKDQEQRRAPLYVFIDEVPSIREECPAWGRVFTKLLREARKVEIHLVVLSQSFLVEDLGINGDTRTNLTVVALGKAVARYLGRAQHINERERQDIIEAARAQTRPAIIDDGAVPVLFQVEGADRVRTTAIPCSWEFDIDAEGDDELLEGLLLSQSRGFGRTSSNENATIGATGTSSGNQFQPVPSQSKAVNCGSGSWNQFWMGLSRDEKLAALAALPELSKNAVYDVVGGNKQHVLRDIDTLRSKQ